MDSDERRKLCWECGGEVPAEAEQCPFCGAAFETAGDESTKSSFFTTSDESDESGSPDLFTETGAPRPLYQPIDKRAQLHSEHSGLEEGEANSEEDESDGGARQQLICLCFLIPGFALLLFGVIMFFFSQEGYLTLKWDASWGMFVFALAGFFIYFGARAYKKL